MRVVREMPPDFNGRMLLTHGWKPWTDNSLAFPPFCFVHVRKLRCEASFHRKSYLILSLQPLPSPPKNPSTIRAYGRPNPPHQHQIVQNSPRGLWYSNPRWWFWLWIDAVWVIRALIQVHPLTTRVILLSL